MLLWFELLSNNNKIKVQAVATDREEKRDKLLQKLIKDRTNERMSEWANEQIERNNVLLLFGQSSEKPHVTHTTHTPREWERE